MGLLDLSSSSEYRLSIEAFKSKGCLLRWMNFGIAVQYAISPSQTHEAHSERRFYPD